LLIKTYAVIPLLASVALVQSSLLFRFSLWGARLHLMLLVLVSWSLLRGAREGIVWGFLGGLALDFLSGLPLGVCTLTLTITAYMASLGQLTVYRTSPLFPAGLALASSIFHDGLLMLLLSLAGYALAWADLLLRVALPSALLGALMMPLVYRVLLRLHLRTLPEDLKL
jgi:rod shape-determining protein MreD